MATETASSPPPARKSALALWWPRVLIVVLIGVVVIEYRAQRGYTDTLNAWSDASDDPESTLLLPAAEELIAMAPSREVIFDGQASQTIRYSWFSLFRGDDYVLSLVASKDSPPEVIRFYTGTKDTAMMPVAPEKFSKPPGPGAFGGMGSDPSAAPNAPTPDDSAPEDSAPDASTTNPGPPDDTATGPPVAE